MRPRTPYDRIAESWSSSRSEGAFRERPWIDRFIDAMPMGGHVLDLGCGSGQPIARTLLGAGLHVTGVDSSLSLLAKAKASFPKACWVAGDMRRLSFRGPFEGVIAWDSIFHVARQEHFEIFATIARTMRPGSPALFSLGGSAGEFEAPMFDVDFFYSGFEPAKSLELLVRAGFTIEAEAIDDPSSRGHLAVMCRRREP